MYRKKKTYSLFQNCSAIFMELCLFWLTISTAFINISPSTVKKDKTETAKSTDSATDEESTTNNNTEEKVPSSNSFSEEYLHDHHEADYFFTLISTFHKCENSDTYT